MSLNVMDGLDLLASPLIQERVTRIADHRPWPMPRGSWVMAQTWTDLLFAHWSVDAATLQSLVPPQLPLDTFEGRAWIGVTPFGVRNTRLRPTLPVPFVSAFPEINVRTYVTIGGKPGIFFFSLDAGSALAVAVARRAYRLPYFRARMSIDRNGRGVSFASERTSSEAPARAEFRTHYWPTGTSFNALPGTLEHWLTERYCLYTLDDDERVLRGDIHHPPWRLQPADADIDLNTMAAELAIELDEDPLLHYARRQDVVFWLLHAAAEAPA
jgi:uncharacterized protein YqjF (DUF2071 family)